MILSLAMQIYHDIIVENLTMFIIMQYIYGWMTQNLKQYLSAKLP